MDGRPVALGGWKLLQYAAICGEPERMLGTGTGEQAAPARLGAEGQGAGGGAVHKLAGFARGIAGVERHSLMEGDGGKADVGGLSEGGAGEHQPQQSMAVWRHS